MFVEYLKMYLLDEVRDCWSVKLMTTNTLNGAGVEDVVKAIIEHKQFLVNRGLYFNRLANRRSTIIAAFILMKEFNAVLRDVVTRYK